MYTETSLDSIVYESGPDVSHIQLDFFSFQSFSYSERPKQLVALKLSTEYVSIPLKYSGWILY